MPEPHPYLGTGLDPEAYYQRHAAAYDNPHAEGILRLLAQLNLPITGRVLDLGCGDGLITKWLQGRPGICCAGVDRAAEMVARYRAETGCPGVVATFEEALPHADWIIASYALHLATPGEEATMWWRMWEAGAQQVVVVTPLKARPGEPQHYFSLARSESAPYGPDRKTIHGRVYDRVEAGA